MPVHFRRIIRFNPISQYFVPLLDYLLQLWEGVFSRAQLELHAASLAEQPEALYACAQGNAAESLSRSKAEYKNGNPIY